MFFSKSPEIHHENFLRFASPNERRAISRESLDFYRALVVGGIYEFASSRNIDIPSTYAFALRKCIETHPWLAVSINASETEKAYFAFCPRLDLSQHIRIESASAETEDEITAIERVLPSILDEPFSHSIPRWKIVVLPLTRTRCFIAFSYSHGFGDGMTGMAFHRTFLDGLKEHHVLEDLIVIPERKELSPPFDTPENLPITWSYLLAPLLGAYLPKTLSSMLGFHASVSTPEKGTWTGAPFFKPDEYRTSVHIMTIRKTQLDQALHACRQNGVRLTGYIHHLIINALSKHLPERQKYDSIVAGTAINLRGSVGVPNDEMGMFVSGDYEQQSLTEPGVAREGEICWDTARSFTNRLSTKSKDLTDQPVGLLRYLTSIRSWLSDKMGQPRDSSYEVSNILAFKPLSEENACRLGQMIFCQPAGVAGSPLNFNVVSVEGGPLTITVNWLPGALNIGLEDAETDFVNKVCSIIKNGFDRIA